MGIGRRHIIKIRIGYLKFQGYNSCKEGFENAIITGQIVKEIQGEKEISTKLFNNGEANGYLVY